MSADDGVAHRRLTGPEYVRLFADEFKRGTSSTRQFVRHPLRASAMYRALGRVAVLDAHLSDDPAGDAIRGALSIGSLARRALLRELERTCKRVAGMRMVVLERSWMRKPCWAARLREDWKQRTLGGPGCWVESEAEESKIEGPLGSPKDMDYHLG